MNALQPLSDHVVDGLSISHVNQVNGDLANMDETASRFLQQRPDVFHGLLGLGSDITDAHRLAGIQILTNLPAQEHDIVRHNSLGEIIRQLLFRIGVARVEFSDALMCHACSILASHERRAQTLIVLHVVHASTYIDDRPEHGMLRDVAHTLSVDPDFTSIANRLTILQCMLQYGASIYALAKGARAFNASLLEIGARMRGITVAELKNRLPIHSLRDDTANG